MIDSAIIDHVTLLRASKLKTIMTIIDIVDQMFFSVGQMEINAFNELYIITSLSLYSFFYLSYFIL